MNQNEATKLTDVKKVFPQIINKNDKYYHNNE